MCLVLRPVSRKLLVIKRQSLVPTKKLAFGAWAADLFPTGTWKGGFGADFMKPLKTFGHFSLAVGSGSAGGVLAARLSEDPNVQVAVMEIGESDDSPIGERAHVPSSYNANLRSQVAWQHSSVPQQHACLGSEEQVRYPEGRSVCPTLSRFGASLLAQHRGQGSTVAELQ